MTLAVVLVGVLLVLFVAPTAWAASIVVAAYDSTPQAKGRADIVCDGVNDEVELLASIADYAGTHSVEVDIAPNETKTVTALGRHSVEWQGGTYKLGAPLIIPDSTDCVIKAEGTMIIAPPSGSAIIVRGINRCRYYFGTIRFEEIDDPIAAAILIQPTAEMPAAMSRVGFTGMMGRDFKGVGLQLDPSEGDIFSNEFVGTHISEVDIGILVGNAARQCHTNWFWASYIVMVNTCIEEQGENVERNTWNVNVEANRADSVAVRTGASHGKWYVIIGTGDWFDRPKVSKTKSLIIEPGAEHNVFEYHPPVETFAPVVDNSGNDTNVILTTMRPPYAPPKAQ